MIGLAGMAYAAGEHPMGGQHSQAGQTGQQAGQAETITGEVQKKEGDMYTVTSEQGEQIRLHIDQAALQGKDLKEGDRIQAKFLKGTEEYTVISAQKAGEGALCKRNHHREACSLINKTAASVHLLNKPGSKKGNNHNKGDNSLRYQWRDQKG